MFALILGTFYKTTLKSHMILRNPRRQGFSSIIHLPILFIKTGFIGLL